MVHLWRGFHHRELVDLLSTAWKKNEPVILVPPGLKDFSFFSHLSTEKIIYHGDWPGDLQALTSGLCGKEQHPILENVALGVFTSGTSTGKGRLVFYSKENVQFSLSAIRDLFDTGRIRKIFCYPQPTHTFGLILGYMQAVLHDLEIHFSSGPYSREAHDQWLKIVDDKTLTLGAPAHFSDLIQYVKSRELAVPQSYSTIVGGARVTLKLWEGMQKILNIEAPSVGYGATEASPGVTHLPPGVRPAEDGDIGYALKGIEVQVFDEGVQFKGPNLCHRILENQEMKAPEQILLRDALLTTDTEKGPRFTFLGRTDSIINRGGIKISLEVVEALIAERIKAPCLAVSLFDQRLGDDLGLIVQSEAGDIKSLVQDIIKSEWGFKIKEDSILLAPIPLNANGKGDRILGIKDLLKQKKWNFPVGVDNLRGLLPHKGPAVWVDSILEVRPRAGVASVKIDRSKNYFNHEDKQIHLRESACIEWVAQSYGYVIALGDILGVHKADAARQTFIAEVKSAEFYFNELKQDLNDGDELEVKVQCTHDFGALKVVEGRVFHNSNLLAVTNMKLYCV